MGIGKVEVNLASAYRLLHPRYTVLVSCVDEFGRANIVTLAWSMPLSIRPPMVAISVAPRRYSHRLIQDAKEFVINIPTMEFVRETLLCGRRTGRRYDKFKEAHLTPLPARIVRPPAIRECIAHLECRLNRQITTGDHTLFIGDVLAAYADEGVFAEKLDVKRIKPVYHVGGDDFVTLSPEIVTPEL